MIATVPPSLRRSFHKETLIDACYFVIRTLRNSGRGYQNPLVSTESDEDVRVVANKAICEIEQQEGMPIASLPADRINEYIAVLEDFTRRTYQRAVGHDSERAANILSEMRSSTSTD
jgi:hypothetical protein